MAENDVLRHDAGKERYMVELRNVSKIYHTPKGREIRAVDGVTLLVPKGKIFGVIGSSGAGKSTLIRLINVLERPTSGEVLIDGDDLLALPERELSRKRRSVGMIFQQFNLLESRTVFGNVALPMELAGVPKEERVKRAAKRIARVGRSDRIRQYPESLAGGQKQRVAIARALALSPKVLLSDEATSALDPANTEAILELIRTINRETGITVILITHEMDVVKSICDEVAIISGGKLVEQGPVREISSRPKTEVAKEFIRTTVTTKLPSDLEEKLRKDPDGAEKAYIRIFFTADSEESPLIHAASEKFGDLFDIISSGIETSSGVKFGSEIISCPAGISAAAVAFLAARHVSSEVLGYV